MTVGGSRTAPDPSRSNDHARVVRPSAYGSGTNDPGEYSVPAGGPFGRRSGVPIRRRLTANPAVTGFAPLDGASRSLAALVQGHAATALKLPQEAGPTLGVCPLDDGVSRVLDLWRRLRERPAWSPALEEECRQVANAQVLDAPDR